MAKKIIYGIICVALIVLVAVFCMKAGKVSNNSVNDISNIISFEDTEQKYHSDISIDFKSESDDLYSEKISLSDKKHLVKVIKNNLNSDVSIRFIDNNGKCVIESQIDKSSFEEIGELSQGEYEMQIDVTKGLEGNLEISFNEE
ncbi:MAG: hypothetical protein UH963_01545 [Agathobacter sp.]|nr:hypothetical protein [Agathobacter sp.]